MILTDKEFKNKYLQSICVFVGKNKPSRKDVKTVKRASHIAFIYTQPSLRQCDKAR